DWNASTGDGLDNASSSYTSSYEDAGRNVVPAYAKPRKNWRIKRTAVPQWYKARAGVRSKAQSGAARVARFRPQKFR
ncbi:MAG: twin-arginine translocase subunit TatB, partial [Comamonas sp.]